MHLKALDFAQSLLNVYICHSWHPKSSTLHSGIKNVLQDSLKEALDPHRRMSSSSEPWGLTLCTGLPYSLIYHSRHPKSTRFYSGIKNVLQDSLVDIMVTHRRFSSSDSPRGLEFCTELPKYLYTSHSWFIPFWNQKCPPRLLGGRKDKLVY